MRLEKEMRKMLLDTGGEPCYMMVGNLAELSSILGGK